MEENIQHSIRIMIRKSLQDKAIEGFRALRKELQSEGGFSRLVRDGENFTFTASGPPIAVLDAIENARKLERVADEAHRSTVDRLKDMLQKAETKARAQREKNLDAVLERTADILIDRSKKK